MNRILEIQKHGQSIWLDNIQRSLIWTGGLYRMVNEEGLKGVTSNPAIFRAAISKSQDYQPALKALVEGGASPLESFEQLAVADIVLACDVLREVHDHSGGRDGFVCLEVSPHHAYDGVATVEEGLRLWQLVSRENLMIKVPATEEGLPAIQELIASGVNVNVSLLFSVERYEEVFDAYAQGLHELRSRGGDPSKVASVASFSLSRIDSLVDKEIEERLAEEAPERLLALKGKAAIAIAKLAYASFLRLIEQPGWKALARQGARAQQLLWAYKDVRYLDELIGPDTVSAVPKKTYAALLEHGEVAPRLVSDQDGARAVMAQLAEEGISISTLSDQLMDQGVLLSQEAFDALIGVIAERRSALLSDRLPRMKLPRDPEVEERLAELNALGFSRRLWMRDGSVWSQLPKGEQEMIARSLGWLSIVDEMHSALGELQELQDELEEIGHVNVVLMGMGGSSRASHVFAQIFGPQPGSPELVVLDSTVPAQVKAIEDQVDLEASLFIVASKSGTTAETVALDSYLFEKSGRDGRSFIVITDPDSPLDQLASERGSSVYCGVPEISGRYLALSPFGMVPAAAMGMDILELLQRARLMVGSCEGAVFASANPGVVLGTYLGEMAQRGRDKLTIIASPALEAFGAWLEQLLAQSVGKQSILPVDREPLGVVSSYGQDRCFVHLRLDGDDPEALVVQDDLLEALEQAKHPVLRIELYEREDIIQEMFRWQLAAVTAAYLLQINPFDQPGVKESKERAGRLLKAYQESKTHPEAQGQVMLLEEAGLTLHVDASLLAELKEEGSLKGALAAHLSALSPGGYMALLAHLEVNEEHDALLQRMRAVVRDRHQVATTLGYGPLHSNGQLHEGGERGVFLQLTCDDPEDILVPGQAYSFGVLKAAQQAGDFMALSQRGRRLLRVHLGANVQAGLSALLGALEA